MLAGTIALVLVIIRLFPATPAGRWLHQHLVELPLQWASRIERRHVIFVVAGLAFAQVFAVAAPLDLALMAAWDVTIYIDVAAAAWAASALARARTIWSSLTARVRSFSSALSPPIVRQRRRRAPRTRTRRIVAAAAGEGGDDALTGRLDARFSRRAHSRRPVARRPVTPNFARAGSAAA